MKRKLIAQLYKRRNLVGFIFKNRLWYSERASIAIDSFRFSKSMYEQMGVDVGKFNIQPCSKHHVRILNNGIILEDFYKFSDVSKHLTTEEIQYLLLLN